MLTEEEMSDTTKAKERETFNKELSEKLSASVKSTRDIVRIDPAAVTPTFEAYEDDHQPAIQVKDVGEVTPEEMDNYVGAEIELPFGGSLKAGKVRGRARDANNEPVGKSHSNPLLDTRSYVVEFNDGQLRTYSANVVAQNILSQCDVDGTSTRMMGRAQE